jgi:exosortase A
MQKFSKTNLGPQQKVFLSVILLAAFFITYLPVWEGLVSAWSRSDEYSHGFFIIPLSLFILWKKKNILARITPSPSAWGLAIIITSLLLYILADLAEISTVASFSMLPLLAGVIIYFYGFKILKENIFSLFLLLFMIPVPAQIYSSLTIPLQLIVSKASALMVSAVGVPIYLEGNVILMPGRVLEVVQACSGLRSLISLLALSLILGYFTLKSNWLRSVLFVSGIPVAIVVNIVRVFFMVLAFYYFNLDLTKGSIHTIYGMAIFFLAIIIILIIRGILSAWDTPIQQK